MYRVSTRRPSRFPTFLVGALALLLGLGAAADAVHFENGDRLTGKLVDAPAEFVAIDVPGVGVVTVPQARVARVVAADAANAPTGNDVGEATPVATPAVPGDDAQVPGAPAPTWAWRSPWGIRAPRI